MAEHEKAMVFVCPHLGSAHDPRTPLDFATSSNRCYAGKSSKRVSQTQQNQLCLTRACIECPIYQDPPLADTMDVIDTLDPDQAFLAQYREARDRGRFSRRLKDGFDARTWVLSVLVLLWIGAIAYFIWFLLLRNSSPADNVVIVEPTITLTYTPSLTPTITLTRDPSITPEATDTPTHNDTPVTAAVEAAVEVTIPPTDTPVPTDTSLPTDTSTPTHTPSPTRTSTRTPTNTVPPTATDTALPTETSTPTSTDTPTSTLTYTPSHTSTFTETPTITLTPTSTFTPSLVPPATSEFTLTPLPPPASEDEVLAVMEQIMNDYGVNFLAQGEWQPTNVQEVIQFYGYLAAIQQAFRITAENLHYFNRISDSISPTDYFRSQFDSTSIVIDFTSITPNVYGVRTLTVDNTGGERDYMLQVSPEGMTDSFGIAREIGFIMNDMLGSAPQQDFQQMLGGSWEVQNPVPSEGYTGYESLFPGGQISLTSDFKDTFGRMLTGQLSPEVSSPRYNFMLDYLPKWSAALEAIQ